MIAAEKVEGADPFPLIASLAASLRASLAPGSAPDVGPVAPTRSADAFRLYAAGREAWDALRLGEAAELLRLNLIDDGREPLVARS